MTRCVQGGGLCGCRSITVSQRLWKTFLLFHEENLLILTYMCFFSLLNFPLKEHRVFKSKSISPQQKRVVNSRAQTDDTKILWCAMLNWYGINWSLTRLSRNLLPIFTRFEHHLIEKLHSLFHSWFLQGGQNIRAVLFSRDQLYRGPTHHILP